MLIESIRSLFGGNAEVEAHDVGVEGSGVTLNGVDPVHLAACALLLEVAYVDGEFSAPEREHLEGVLARHFDLAPEIGAKLIELAEDERRRAIDQFHFTSVLQRSYDLGQKMVLAEVMWGLVLADGTISDREHYLTRKIANLLDLEPGYLSTAKAAAARGRGEAAE